MPALLEGGEYDSGGRVWRGGVLLVSGSAADNRDMLLCSVHDRWVQECQSEMQ